MSITTTANPGIEIQTAAKQSVQAGSAAALGSQAGALSDEVIVPTAIGTNNEGNLEASPSYVGRHFLLRPLTQIALGGGIASSAIVAAGGTGYAVNDTLTVSGGTSNNAATFNVDSVDSGVVTAVSLITHGDYTVTPANSASTTGGGGTGCTLDITYIDGEELRFITADASNTLTVNEDWVNEPVSGEDWAISYILEDCATLTGCTASSKTGVFECSRRVHVGDAATTDFAFFGIAEGKGMEVDDVGGNRAGLVITDGGYWAHGYLQGGVSINGGFIFAFNNTAGENMIEFEDGGRAYMYDIVWASQLVDMEIVTAADTGTSVREVRTGKIFGATNPIDIDGWFIRDLTISGPSPATNLVQITGDTDIDGLTLINTQGLDGPDDTLTEEYTLKNVTFAGNNRHILVHDDKTWNIVNPVGWIADSTFISFEIDDLNEVNKLISLDISVSETDTTAIENALLLIYDESQLSFPLEYRSITDELGEESFNLLEEKYTFPGSVFTTETFGPYTSKIYKYGFTPFQTSLTLEETGIDSSIVLGSDPNISVTQESGVFGNQDIVINKQIAVPYDSLTVDFTVDYDAYCADDPSEGFFMGKVYHDDNSGTTGTLYTDFSRGFPIIGELLQDHDSSSSFGTADVSASGIDIPYEVLQFNAGAGTLPSKGDTIIGQTSAASGKVVQVFGDASEGYMLLGHRDNTAFSTTGETIDDSVVGGSWTATHNQASPDFHDKLDYTWLIDANNHSYTETYEHLAALMSKPLNPLVFLGSGSSFVDFTTEAASNTEIDIVLADTLGDSTYIGHRDHTFSEITIDLGFESTIGHLSRVLAWEYYNGSTWVALPDINDQTVQFIINHSQNVYFTVPIDWAKTDPGMGIEGYWIRARVTTSAGAIREADKIWTNRTFDEVHNWATDELTQLMFSGPNGFFTSRNVTKEQGVIVANAIGSTDFFTANDGTEFTPPQQLSLTLEDLKSNSEIRIYENVAGKAGNELSGIENSSTSFIYNYTHSGSDIDIIIVIFHLNWREQRIFTTLTDSSTSIPIQQQTDRVYNNP